MNFKTDVWFAQRFLTAAGCDPKGIDGLYGKDTAAAEARFNQKIVAAAEKYGRFDDRTEGNIMTLLPQAQILARRAMVAVSGKLGNGVVCKILSGTRTYAEQTAIYAQGRTKPGNIVTNAKAGYSNHNFGIAFDIGLFGGNGKVYWDGMAAKGKSAKERAAQEEAYIIISKLIKPVGLAWGGDWKSSKDTPHYEIATGRSLTAVRNAFNAGKPYF